MQGCGDTKEKWQPWPRITRMSARKKAIEPPPTALRASRGRSSEPAKSEKNSIGEDDKGPKKASPANWAGLLRCASHLSIIARRAEPDEAISRHEGIASLRSQ